MTRSLLQLVAIAAAHAELESGKDIEALLATMEGEPVYDFYPVGKRFRGMANTRRYYRHFFDELQPRIVAFTFVSEAIGEAGAFMEYIVRVRHADNEDLVDHRVLGILTFGEQALTGERLYADERFFRMLTGPLWDELETITPEG